MKKADKTFLHAYVVLVILIIISCLLTYIIPAGSFERVKSEALGQTIVVAGSYKGIENTPISPLLIFHKLYEAVSEGKTAALIFFLLFVSGAFEVILKTGCMENLCQRLMEKLNGKELAVIPIFVCLFSIFGFTMGLTTASIVFVPLGISIALSSGFPKIVGISMVALGTNAGFTAGIFNPFSVGVAQNIAEIPLYSGQSMRWLSLVLLNTVTSLYLLFYAKRHRELRVERVDLSIKKMTSRQMIEVFEFITAFGILTTGIAIWKWETADIVVVFLITAIIIGKTEGFSVTEICTIFTEGSKKIMKGAMIVGLAATIRLILSQGNILDTITYTFTQMVEVLPSSIQLFGMFFFNAVLNLLVTSGSAKAALVMPILTPMADFLGLSRQSTVFAFQLGDGLTNLSSPISTTLNGVMAVSDIEYGEWIKFYLPLVLIYMVTGSGLVILAQIISY
ncbi:MAG: AbgT family transporter [Lachnospiraceae bacterium]|nr:AbgT family transporter [Lachnospiraceae bacterium]